MSAAREALVHGQSCLPLSPSWPLVSPLYPSTRSTNLPTSCSATSEAQAAFSNGACFIEKYVGAPRHIEVQVSGSDAGCGPAHRRVAR